MRLKSDWERGRQASDTHASGNVMGGRNLSVDLYTAHRLLIINICHASYSLSTQYPFVGAFVGALS